MSSPPVRSASLGTTEVSRVDAARRLGAVVLTATSAALARLAMRLERPAPPVDSPLPRLEFHCDAGAPEGALYLDGRLVARVRGVNRL